MKRLIILFFFTLSSINIFTQNDVFDCGDFQLMVEFQENLLPCDGGAILGLYILIFETDSSLSDLSITIIDNLEGETQNSSIVIDNSFGVSAFQFIHPNFSGDFDFTLIITNYEDCEINYAGYAWNYNYNYTNNIGYINPNTTINKPIVDQKLNKFPAQI